MVQYTCQAPGLRLRRWIEILTCMDQWNFPRHGCTLSQAVQKGKIRGVGFKRFHHAAASRYLAYAPKIVHAGFRRGGLDLVYEMV